MKKVGITIGLILSYVSLLFAQEQFTVENIPLAKILNPKTQPYDEWGVILKNKSVENRFGNKELEEITRKKSNLKRASLGSSSNKTPCRSKLKLVSSKV